MRSQRLARRLLPIGLLAGTLGAGGTAGAQDAYSAGTLTRVAFGSCLHQDRPQPVWRAIADAEPDLFVFLGDNIYADTEDVAAKRQAYDRVNRQPGYQALRRLCPVWATWDDHDFGVNDCGAEYPMKEESRRLFLDCFEEPADSPRRRHAGVYDARIYGPPGRQVQIILLDTRFFRGPLVRRAIRFPGEGPYEENPDRSATMLGDEQWAWLREQLRAPADVRIIASSIQVVAEHHNWEKWMNLPHERQLLFDLISDAGAEGVLFVSGDRHQAELSMMDAGIGYPIYDLTCSSLNMSRQGPIVEINPRRVSEVYPDHNFGLITLDWEPADPLITLEVRDEEGVTRIRHELRLSTLRAGPAGAAPADSRLDEPPDAP
jgi:alkaline phosphatase D